MRLTLNSVNGRNSTTTGSRNTVVQRAAGGIVAVADRGVDAPEVSAPMTSLLQRSRLAML